MVLRHAPSLEQVFRQLCRRFIIKGVGTVSEIEVEVQAVAVDQSGNHMVMLGDKEKRKLLPIVIGPVEARAIWMNLQGITPERPLTHNLLKHLLDLVGAKVQKVVITDIKDGTFYALLHVEYGGEVHKVDARPSDAIALALAFDAPVYIDLRLIEFTLDPADLNIQHN
ncbi:MAG TPA: bifunctional nuclease family protein [Firmicutes bacterium]|nr:bifunctional nuclease family protein [Bacillota bacterium]